MKSDCEDCEEMNLKKMGRGFDPCSALRYELLVKPRQNLGHPGKLGYVYLSEVDGEGGLYAG